MRKFRYLEKRNNPRPKAPEPRLRKTKIYDKFIDDRYPSQDAAQANVLSYIKQFYNTTRRHATIGNGSPIEFERKAELAQRLSI